MIKKLLVCALALALATSACGQPGKKAGERNESYADTDVGQYLDTQSGEGIEEKSDEPASEEGETAHEKSDGPASEEGETAHEKSDGPASEEGGTAHEKSDGSDPEESEADMVRKLLNPEGKTLETRILTPDGYTRVQSDAGSLLAFLRDYPLKEDGSPVLLFDGTQKYRQDVHAAVFQLPIEKEDLQQCADSIMRVYAEYFWHSGQYDRIAFHFVNGFHAQYVKWREGYRVQVDGNETTWVMTAGYDDSYENFQKYLRIVFSYAGTLSMEAESAEIDEGEIAAGDVFLKGGSPGHVVMVVDVCKDPGGKKAFLLAQGYMPAQEFHLLKNPLHEDDPWYYETELNYPLQTPEYVFEEGSLRRLPY